MNRRTAINNLTLAASGLIILPQWMVSCGLSDKQTHNSSFNVTEQQLLAAIADTIIPAGNSIGAITVGVDKYLQKLFDDCFEKTAQENIKSQLKRLDNFDAKKNNKSFNDSSAKERTEILTRIHEGEDKPLKDFVDLVKSESIRGFTTSQQVMQNYLGYKVAPGHYHGCVNVNS